MTEAYGEVGLLRLVEEHLGERAGVCQQVRGACATSCPARRTSRVVASIRTVRSSVKASGR